MNLDVDLTVESLRPDGTTTCWRVRGRGREVVVELAPGEAEGVMVPAPRGSGGGGIDWAGVRALADLLSTRGLAVHVERGGRRLMTLGGTDRGGVWRLAGAPAVRPGRPRDLVSVGVDLAGGRLLRGARAVRRLPAVAELAPARNGERPATVVIGSHPACDLVLPGLRPRHAVLGRDVEGRSVLRALAGGCFVDGSPVVSQVVDADSDIRVGEHRVSLGELEPQAW